MPIIVNKKLPAYKQLRDDNVFAMAKFRAQHQDIRPLRIGLLNLMPTKIATETQIARLLSHTSLQVELILLKTETYTPKHVAKEHLDTFYMNLDDALKGGLDGLIITGAPVEQMPFEKVRYWKELEKIMDYGRKYVASSIYICWGAQAAMYHYYGINKKPLEKKCFGVFEHDVKDKKSKLFHGFDEVYLCPHSRHTMVDKKDIEAVKELLILSESEEAGVNICATKDYKEIYVFGHMEYDKETLGKEYFRDVEQGLDINIPKNYFLNDDPTEKIVRRWHAHAQLFYSNWLNYCVYQETPFVLTVPEEQMQ